MKIVTKWVAGFNHQGELVVVSHGFRETPKLFIMMVSITDHGDQMRSLLNYQTRFDRQQDGSKLHDTKKAAVAALMSQQRLDIISAEGTIGNAYDRIREINIFNLTLE